jgi:hypothetical protein
MVTYPLLGELTGTLVLGVAEQLNAAALIGRKTGDLLDDVTDERGALAQVTLRYHVKLPWRALLIKV